MTVADGAIKPLTKLGWNGIPGLIWEPDGTGLYSVAGAKQARWESQIWHISYPEGEVRASRFGSKRLWRSSQLIGNGHE